MPSFVLIHGGSTSGRYWDRVRPLLGFPTLAPDLPGRGERACDLMTLTVDACVDALAADVSAAQLPDPLVLVAHSSGGLVVPGLGARLGTRVGHLVFCSGSVPPEGGRGLDCMKPKHAESCQRMLESARTEGRSVDTLAAGLPTREQARVQYGGDPLPDALIDYVLDPVRRVGDSFNVYFQPISWHGVSAALPRTYIKNLRDRALPLSLQMVMIARLGAATRTIALDDGHIPEVVMPEVIAALLNGIAAELVAPK